MLYTLYIDTPFFYIDNFLYFYVDNPISIEFTNSCKLVYGAL